MARVPVCSGQTAILKAWVRPGLKGTIRRLTRTGSARREWRALRRLAVHLRVPTPFALFRVPSFGYPYTDGVLMEDLGPNTMATGFVRSLVSQDRMDKLSAFDSTVLDLTRGILAAGVLDPDHSIVNMVILQSGETARLDFELARVASFPGTSDRCLGNMLGRLLASYTFVVQPRIELANSFAARLFDAVQPSTRTLRRVRLCVEREMRQQERTKGITLKLDF